MLNRGGHNSRSTQLDCISKVLISSVAYKIKVFYGEINTQWVTSALFES